MTETPQTLQWTGSFAVAPKSRTPQLPGDKLLLPPSALEQLLAAAPTVVSQPETSRPYTSTFDPFNPYTYAAERAARAQFEERQQQLPHPLTFRLVNPQNGHVIYAGIREFSAEEGEIALSKSLKEALGIKEDERSNHDTDHDADTQMSNGVEELDIKDPALSTITVHAKQLPKGTFVKLRPLEAGYDPEDWKALLEQHLRANYTTLTNGEILVVPGTHFVGGRKEEFRFLVDGFKPEGDGICIVDTDLEVDIEALNEEQARETLKKIAAKAQRAPGTLQGSSVGGTLGLFKEQHDQVLPGEYIDYELPSWDRSQGVEIELNSVDEEVDLYVSPYASRQRVKPRDDEYVFADTAGRPRKRIWIQPKNVELEDADALWVSVHAFSPSEAGAEDASQQSPKQYSIRISPFDPATTKNESTPPQDSDVPPNPGDVRCKNCHQWVPRRTLVLHENFCLRNNILCPRGCGQVFQKRSEEWKNHWHCPHDTFYGNSALSHRKHDYQYHTEHTCPGCGRTFPSLPLLAAHRTSVCPAKLILCQFCHLEVPQEGDPDEPDPQAILSGLTPHELADGARTTECHMCNKIVRLRDMKTHLLTHEMEKASRPTPRVCRNVLCGRTLDGTGKNGDTRAGTKMGQGPGNDIGLCSVCFGPLYVAMHDPEGKALKRRVERRYLMQLVTGCGKSWCKNEFCKTGRKNLEIEGTVSTKEALPMVKPYVDAALDASLGMPLHFCTDEGSQKRRGLAELLAAERDLKGQRYAFEWYVAALEAEGGDLQRAREWLKNWAPVES